MNAAEEIICTACPKHCVIGILGITDIPKDSETPILNSDGKDIRELCIENYVEPEISL